MMNPILKKVLFGVVVIGAGYAGYRIYKHIKTTTEDNDNKVILPLETNLVGVTFDNRQELIKNLKDDGLLWILSAPTTEFPDSIGVNNDDGKCIGYFEEHLAKKLKYNMGKGYGYAVKQWKRLGGTAEKPNFGIRVTLSLGSEPYRE